MPTEHEIKDAAIKQRSPSPSMASSSASSNDGEKGGDASVDQSKERGS